MRLFVGIPLAATVIAELSAIAARLRTGEEGLRWSAPESWHITLQFLGNTTAEKYECVCAGLREVDASPVPVQLGELDFFDRAGVFFTDVVVAPELVALQRLVVAANRGCGFEPETRPYHPHITLARTKRDGRGGDGRGQRLKGLKEKLRQQPKLSQFVAQEFLLYESVLERSGARYEVRARFALN